MRLTLTIEGFGYGGEGFARTEHGFVSVPHALPGERVTVHVGELVRGRAWAELVERHTDSPERIDSPCPHHDRCRGCALLHVSAERERQFKIDSAREVLEKFGPAGASDLPIEWVATGLRLGFRVRGRFRVERRDGSVAIGLQSTALDGSVADVWDCPAQSEGFRAEMAVRRTALLDADELPEYVEIRPEHVEPWPGVRVEAPATSWSPTFPEASRLAAAWATEWADSGGFALDLCAGLGFTTFALAERCARVLAVDRDHLGLEALAEAAPRHVETRAGDIGTILRKLRSELSERPSFACINPMRKPLGAKAMVNLGAMGPERVVYLGPSPTSAAKDAKALVGEGYRVAEVAAIDLHPATAQFMLGVRLERC